MYEIIYTLFTFMLYSSCFMVSSSHFTFRVADVRCEAISVDTESTHIEDLGKKPYFRESFFTIHENISLNVYRSTDSLIRQVPFQNGFVGTVFQAYNKHHKLSISPDHVWLAIIQAFNIYMNEIGKAEDLREQFVMHKGKIKLEVRGVGTLQTVDWSNLVGRMSALIKKKTKIGVHRWVVPNFSTTTKTDKMVGELFLMATLKQFFNYKFSLMCGIPEITLEGNVHDWGDIRQRIEKLKELGLTKWYKKLVPVIDEFVKTARGEPNIEFWSKVCHRKSFGSGPSYLGGWLNVFIPFIGKKYVLPEEEGNYGIVDTNEIPGGISTVPFELNDNGKYYKLDFCFGFFGCTKKNNVEIRPSLDWLIRDQYNTTINPLTF